MHQRSTRTLEEMRRDAQERTPFAARLEHEMQMPMLEITNAAVHEPRRPAGRPAGEVVALDQGGAEPAHRGVARDAGAGDATPDHEHVEQLLSQSRQPLGACHQ